MAADSRGGWRFSLTVKLISVLVPLMSACLLLAIVGLGRYLKEFFQQRAELETARLERKYFERRPGSNSPNQMVSFGNSGKGPGEQDRELTAEFGYPYYTRIDGPATPEQKVKLLRYSPDAVRASTFSGEPIIAKLTHASCNNAAVGGLKGVAAIGWFAARPLATGNI